MKPRCKAEIGVDYRFASSNGVKVIIKKFEQNSMIDKMLDLVTWQFF